MSVSFAVGSNFLEFTAGSAGAVGTGAFSLFALVQPGVGNNNAGFVAGYASTTLVRGVGESSLHLYGPNDFSPSGFGTLTQGTWYIVGVTKAIASAPWRMHARAIGGAWSHGVATSAANQGNGSAVTAFRIGSVGIAAANGLIGAWAAWTSELADAVIDTIDDTTLQSWANITPQELVSLENWAGAGAGSATLIGTSAYSSTTGTGSVGANPAGYSFAVSGGGSPVTVGDVPSGFRIRSGADVGVTSNVVVPDSPAGTQWRSSNSVAITVALAMSDPVSGWRLRSGAETVSVAVTAQDNPGGWRLASAYESAVLGFAVPDVPNGFRLNSPPDPGVVSVVLVSDAPFGTRWRSADGLGVTSVVTVADQASGWRLGAPSGAVTFAGVVSDTPGGTRWLSGASTVTIQTPAGPITISDVPGGWRWRPGVEAGVLIAGPLAIPVSMESTIWIDRWTPVVDVDRFVSLTTVDQLR